MKQVSIDDLVNNGVIQEVNRRWLHPMGYALGYEVNDKTGEKSNLKILETDDSNGIVYGEKHIADNIERFKGKMDRFSARMNERLPARAEALGFVMEKIVVPVNEFIDAIGMISEPSQKDPLSAIFGTDED